MRKGAGTLIWENGSANAIMQNWIPQAYNYFILKISLSFTFLLLSTLLVGQDSLQTNLVIPGTYKTFTADNLGNFYLVNEENEVSKVSIDKHYDYLYDNNELGDIARIDATNPLNILVGYSEMQTITVLDVTLRETSLINIPDLSIIQDSLVFGLSIDNKIWVYDAFETQLIKIGEQEEIIERSQRLVDVLGYIPQITFLAQDENYIVLNEINEGLIVLDAFGNYVKTLPIKGLNEFILVNEQIAYMQHGQLIANGIETAKRSILGNLQTNKLVAAGENLYFLNELGVHQVIFTEKN